MRPACFQGLAVSLSPRDIDSAAAGVVGYERGGHGCDTRLLEIGFVIWHQRRRSRKPVSNVPQMNSVLSIISWWNGSTF